MSWWVKNKMASLTMEPRTDDKLLWLAVDLDNTLAEPMWPKPGIGEPLWDNVEKLRKAVEAGYKVIIHTSRTWSDYELVETWLWMNDIPFHRILCGKVLAIAYIDDRNIDPDSESWIPE